MIGKRIRIANMRVREVGIDAQIAQWIYDSHYWDEETLYNFRCNWCNTTWGPGMTISRDWPLCPKNPVLHSFVGETAMANIKKAIMEA